MSEISVLAERGAPATLLSVSNLSKSYGLGQDAATIIQGLSFGVRRQEVVCIVGPSGVGKTTLLKCLVGLQPLSDGVVEIEGRRITGPPPQMALVFQDYTRSLMPWLTSLKNVLLPLRHLRIPKSLQLERANEALQAVGLEKSGKQYPWEMSGGMQQRVAIARALAYRPEILIMDEPFASVDAQTRFELEDLCLQIRRQFSMTILLVTHDIDEAVYLSDRIVVLGGRPATVTKTLDVGLGNMRSQLTTRASPEFGSIRTSVLELIQSARVGGVDATSTTTSSPAGSDAKRSS